VETTKNKRAGGKATSRGPLILRQKDFDAHLPEMKVVDALRSAFAGLADGRAAQPPQSWGVVGDEVDIIWYPGILADQKLFGAKLSPYFPSRKTGPKVTAWTVLFSTETGEPTLLCDSFALTTERTAATTALALQLLVPAGAKRLAVIGVGVVGMAHLRYAAAIHDWNQISLYSRKIDQHKSIEKSVAPALRKKVKIAPSAEAAVSDSDVILLCTSSGTPVIDHRWLRPGQLVTSISTNVANAHEIAAEAIPGLEVYCDYRATTPSVAGEMKLAAQQHGWSPQSVRGDLPEMVKGKATLPSGQKPIFFRSVGLGIEDIAIASVLLQNRQKNKIACRGGSSR